MIYMRGKRAESKIIDDSFDNWCIEHEEEINEILQPFIKISSKAREIKNNIFIYHQREKLNDSESRRSKKSNSSKY